MMKILLKIDNIEKNILYKTIIKDTGNKVLEDLKNEVVISKLFTQDINYLAKQKYKILLNLLSEEYKISWALYKIFEYKDEWVKSDEFSFEVLYETNLNNIKNDYKNILNPSLNEKFKKILEILDKSQLHYRMTNKYKFIFNNLGEEINDEFEQRLKNTKELKIDIYKFILIRDWVNKSYMYSIDSKYQYFSGCINKEISSNIYIKLSRYVNYKSMQKNMLITKIINQSITTYKEFIIENIHCIDDWKVLSYLEDYLGGILEIHFNSNDENIKNHLSFAYFNVLLDKRKYKNLYLNEKLKRELYVKVSDYMKINNKKLKEIINDYKEYKNLSELEERNLINELNTCW